MHPLLNLLLTQPGLVGEHAQGYAELLAGEVGLLKQAAQRRLVWGAATAGLALTGAVLGGVALMLGAALPALPAAATWVLLATPGVPLLAALGCLLRLFALPPSQPFASTRAQLQADLQMFNEVSAR